MTAPLDHVDNAVGSVSDNDTDIVSTGRKRSKRLQRGAGGVVFDEDGLVLMLRHVSGAWVFPKGHVESGETELQAAIREVEEESGVRARPFGHGSHDGPQSWTTSYVNPRGVPRHITWFALRGESEPVLTEDTFTDVAYRQPARALELLSHETDRELLRAVLAVLPGDAGNSDATSAAELAAVAPRLERR